MKHFPTTPGYRAALLAGAHLLRKDGSADLESIVKAIDAHTKATNERLGTVDEKMAGLVAQLLDLEQKEARRLHHYGGSLAEPTWGEQFAADPELKSFAEYRARPSRHSVQMKTTISSAIGSGGDLFQPQRDPSPLILPKRRLTVRNLLPVVRVSTGSVEYPKQTTRTNNGAPVAEGDLKPESAYAFDLATVPIRTIAHWVPASRQILDDAPQLAGIIDTELRYGLALKEEEQLLNGSGTGQNLFGLVTEATAFSAPITITSPTMIDTIGLAILQSALADLPADGVVIHPSDWMRMRLLKDGQGHYLLGAPNADVEPRLFGLPVVPTPAMASDKFLVGNFQAAATVYDRWEARVEVSTEHADYFVRNLVAILAEERIGLAVKQPLALTYGDFGNEP